MRFTFGYRMKIPFKFNCKSIEFYHNNKRRQIYIYFGYQIGLSNSEQPIEKVSVISNQFNDTANSSLFPFSSLFDFSICLFVVYAIENWQMFPKFMLIWNLKQEIFI